MRVVARDLVDAGADAERIFVSLERNMHCAVRHCGHCQLGPLFVCADGPVVTWAAAGPAAGGATVVSEPRRPTDARGVEVRVVRRLPALAARLRGRAAGRRRSGADRLLPRGDPSDGRRARTTCPSSRARSPPRTTSSASRSIRAASRRLVTIGACATAGGIQALRNYADVEEYVRIVYATPSYISTLATSTPISAHVPVDFELRGCPIDKRQLLDVIAAFLGERRPNVAGHSVCVECKLRGNVCVMVADGTPCLGPITHAGCGALCPTYDRGCYGCFGPAEDPNPAVAVRAARPARRRSRRPRPDAAHVQHRRRAVPRGERAARRRTESPSDPSRRRRPDLHGRRPGPGGGRGRACTS